MNYISYMLSPASVIEPIPYGDPEVIAEAKRLGMTVEELLKMKENIAKSNKAVISDGHLGGRKGDSPKATMNLIEMQKANEQVSKDRAKTVANGLLAWPSKTVELLSAAYDKELHPVRSDILEDSKPIIDFVGYSIAPTFRSLSAASGGRAYLKNIQRKSAFNKVGSVGPTSVHTTEIKQYLTDPKIIKETKDKLVNLYTSKEYKKRLLLAGFTEEEANLRIQSLLTNILNTRLHQGHFTDGTAAATAVDPTDFRNIDITIDASLVKDLEDLKSILYEEFAHASELSGVLPEDVTDQMIQIAGSVEAYKQKFPGDYETLIKAFESPLYKNLKSETASTWNESLGGTLSQRGLFLKTLEDVPRDKAILFYRNYIAASPNEQLKMLEGAIDYYGTPTERRARALGWVLEMQDRFGKYVDAKTAPTPITVLGKDAINIYSGNEDYLNKFITGAGVVGTTIKLELEKQGGSLNYLNYFKQF